MASADAPAAVPLHPHAEQSAELERQIGSAAAAAVEPAHAKAAAQQQVSGQRAAAAAEAAAERDRASEAEVMMLRAKLRRLRMTGAYAGAPLPSQLCIAPSQRWRLHCVNGASARQV